MALHPYIIERIKVLGKKHNGNSMAVFDELAGELRETEHAMPVDTTVKKYLKEHGLYSPQRGGWTPESKRGGCASSAGTVGSRAGTRPDRRIFFGDNPDYY